MSKGATHVTLMDPRLTPGTAVTAVGGFDPEAANHIVAFIMKGVYRYMHARKNHML